MVALKRAFLMRKICTKHPSNAEHLSLQNDRAMAELFACSDKFDWTALMKGESVNSYRQLYSLAQQELAPRPRSILTLCELVLILLNAHEYEFRL